MFLYSCPNEKFWKEIHGNQIKFQSRVNGYPISDPIVVWCIDNFDPTDYTCKRVLHNNCAGFHWTRASNVDSSCCKLAVSGNSFAYPLTWINLMLCSDCSNRHRNLHNTCNFQSWEKWEESKFLLWNKSSLLNIYQPRCNRTKSLIKTSSLDNNDNE